MLGDAAKETSDEIIYGHNEKRQPAAGNCSARRVK